MKKQFRLVGWILVPLAAVVAFIVLTAKSSLPHMLVLTALLLLGFCTTSSFVPKIRNRIYLGVVLIGVALFYGSAALMLFISVWPGAIFVLCFLLSIFLLIYYVLAPRDIWFTFVEEGTAKTVVRGEQFQRALIQWNGYTLDRNPNPNDPEAAKWNIIPGKERHILGGIRFFGIWPLDRIYEYKFEWTGLKSDGSLNRHPPEQLKHIFLKQYVYYAEVEKAEDDQRLPLNVSFVLTVAVKNPYKALFKVHNWLDAVMGRIVTAIRNEIAKKPYETLISRMAGISSDIYRDGMNEMVAIFKKDYGIEVLNLEIQKIDPPNEQREATLKEYVAKQDAKRIVVEAQARADAVVIEAKAKAEAIERINTMIQKFGKLGELVRYLEALEKGSSEGGKWVLAIPGIGEFLSKAFPNQGGKS